uniref:Uncharacterized protein n=1 Tax=Anguilla anguilla TaxID=7936 RepID=A0A0E9RY21_ANGAN
MMVLSDLETHASRMSVQLIGAKRTHQKHKYSCHVHANLTTSERTVELVSIH